MSVGQRVGKNSRTYKGGARTEKNKAAAKLAAHCVKLAGAGHLQKELLSSTCVVPPATGSKMRYVKDLREMETMWTWVLNHMNRCSRMLVTTQTHICTEPSYGNNVYIWSSE